MSHIRLKAAVLMFFAALFWKYGLPAFREALPALREVIAAPQFYLTEDAAAWLTGD